MQLREKKKQDRRDRIYRSAMELFGTHGYEATTIEQIAEKAYLAVGTVYNYFSSKGDLLLSLLVDRWKEGIGAGEQVSKRGKKDLLHAVEFLTARYIGSFSTYPKRVWREFVSVAMSKQPGLMEDLWQMDRTFIDELTETLGDFQERGDLSADVSIEDLAQTIYSVLITNVLRYLTADPMSLEALKKSMGAQVKIICKGITRP
ncbi:MAG: TetR/AcrR family transcriptional regulator [bacterium]